MSTGEQVELDALLRRVAQEPVRYPPGLVSRSLATVRGIRGLASDEAFELAQQDGRLRVARQAINTLVRRMAGEFGTDIGGLHVRSVRSDVDGIEVSVDVGYGTPLASTTALRDALTEALTSHLGPRVPIVRVHIEDVFDPFE